MAITDNDNCIKNGLRADIMRSSMENKNLLKTKGSIYIGSGSSITKGDESIARTEALNPGEAGDILMVGGDKGIQYSKLKDENFTENTYNIKVENARNADSAMNALNAAEAEYASGNKTATIDSRIESLKSQIGSLASGSPKGVYTDVNALQTAIPDGDENIYVCTDTGHWYYWNGSSWVDGGVYQATEIVDGSVDINKLELENQIRNVLDPTSFKSGYYGCDGTLLTGNSYTICEIREDYWYNLNMVNGKNNQNLIFFDEDMNVTHWNNGGQNSVKSLIGDKYLVFNKFGWIPTRDGLDWQIIESRTNICDAMPTEYLDFTKGYKIKYLLVDKFNIVDGSITKDKLESNLSSLLLDKFEKVDLNFTVGFMDKNGGLSDYSGCNHAIINVTKGEVYNITTSHGSNAKLYVLVNEDGSGNYYYPTNTASVATETITLTIPSNGTLYVNTYNVNITNVAKKTGYSLGNDNVLSNKKIIFFGDSITEGGGSWADPSTIALKNNMIGANLGKGGATYTVKDTSNASNNIYLRIQYYLSTYSDSDYIILQGGVNDAFQSLPLGTMSSLTDFTTELDTSNFAGAFEMAIRYVLTNWLGKKVGFIANCRIPRNPNLYQYLDMAKDICKKYSLPILDLFNESGLCAGIQVVNETYYNIDSETIGHGGTHPTAECYEKYLNNKVEEFIKRL